MIIKSFDHLPSEARSIRETVFVNEQGFNYEFDDIDNISTHLVLYVDDIAAATCRFFMDEIKDTYIIGRIAVLKNYRKLKLGSQLLQEAENLITKKGGKLIRLSAQLQAVEFYRKNGYIDESETHYDESYPHVWMYKKIPLPKGQGE